MTLSMPVKIVALAALALVLGLGGVVLLTSHPASSKNNVATPPAVYVVKHTAVVHKPVVQLDANLPLILRPVLEKHATAVVAIYSSRIAGDRAMLAAARAGAREAHVGFLAANVAIEKIAVGVATWSDVARDPVVIVVRRPGKVVFAVSGLTDDATIAQAAASAR
jgi:hypothetical protein